VSDNQNKRRSEADAELEREIRSERKFTLEEAIGRMAGPGAMKGESPVTRLQQAQFEISSWLRSHVASGGLEVVLTRDVKDSELLLQHVDQPLLGLAIHFRQILDSDHRLKELVRHADTEWGRMMQERPFFDQEGSPPHPDDPYTIESVRNTLSGLLKQLKVDDG
jgi:hypothetical protein